MNAVQRIAKNSGVLLLSQAASYILVLFFSIYTARYLGVENFGILAFALAFTGIFGIFSDVGLSTLMLREVARDKSLAGKYLGNILIMKLILGTVTFGLIALVITTLGYPGKTVAAVYLLALSVILSSFSSLFNSIFQAYEKMEYRSIGQILNGALMFSGALLAISLGFDVTGFASVIVFANMIVLIYGFIICVWKFAVPRVKVDWSFLKQTVKEALPFGLTGMFITIYMRTDSVILSLTSGDAAVGLYNAAYQLILGVLFIPGAFNSAIFPILSRLYVSSMNSLKFTLEKYFKLMIIVGLPIGVQITLLADRIILLIFGSEYMPSVPALQILAWGMMLIFARTAFEHVLYSTNRQIVVTKVFGFCTILNVILNVVMIPRYSYVGASVAMLMTNIAIFAIIFSWSLRFGYSVSKKRIIEIISKVIVASLLMGCFIIFFGEQNLLILVPASAIVYLGVILLIKTLDKEDIGLIENLFGTKVRKNET